MRIARIERKTGETDISIELNVDGKSNYDIQTPIGFLTHMLESFAKHGLFDIRMRAKGDLEVDQHHLIEDCGIVLGQAFKKDRSFAPAALFNGRSGIFINIQYLIPIHFPAFDTKWLCNLVNMLLGADLSNRHVGRLQIVFTNKNERQIL